MNSNINYLLIIDKVIKKMYKTLNLLLKSNGFI